MTGGSGTYLFAMGGILLTAGSVYGLRQKRKKDMNN